MSLGNQEAPRWIRASGTSFREDLFGHENISTTILPLPLYQEEHLSVNGELSTGNLPWGGLLRNSVDSITDCLDMTSAVDRGRKALTQTKQKSMKIKKVVYLHILASFY